MMFLRMVGLKMFEDERAIRVRRCIAGNGSVVAGGLVTDCLRRRDGSRSQRRDV
jgi:hypothetical protein